LDVALHVEEEEKRAGFLGRDFAEKAKARRQEGRKLVEEISVHRFLSKPRKGHYGFLKKGGVDHIHLSAPLRSKDYEDNAFAQAFVDYVTLLKPKTGMYDSSLEILQEENIEILETMIAGLHRVDYQIRLMILDASEYGDPIETKRVVLCIAEETVYLPKRPITTHAEGSYGEGFQRGW
jgi:hypothetical protein